MSKTYFLYHNQRVTSLQFEQIVDKLSRDEVSWTDFCAEEGQTFWTPLFECIEFRAAMDKKIERPQIEVPTVEKTEVNHVEKTNLWFVNRSGVIQGPFSYLEIVRQLQSGALSEFHFVAPTKESATARENFDVNTLVGWKKIAEQPEFSVEAIRALKDSGLDVVNKVFFRRRYPRKHYEAEVLAHNQSSVWRGFTIEVSAGGAAFVIQGEINKSELRKGNPVFLHVKEGNGLPPFNALGTIVSCSEENENRVRFSVEFTKVSQDVKDSLVQYTGARALSRAS